MVEDLDVVIGYLLLAFQMVLLCQKKREREQPERFSIQVTQCMDMSIYTITCLFSISRKIIGIQAKVAKGH